VGLNRLTLQRQHGEGALVDAAQRLVAHEAFQPLDDRCKFAPRRRPSDEAIDVVGEREKEEAEALVHP